MKSLLKSSVIKPLAILLLLFIAFRVNALIGAILLVLLALVLLYTYRALIYTVKGNKSYTANNKDIALNWYKKAAEVKGAKPKTKTTYAYMLLKEKQLEEAEAVLKDVLKTKVGIAEEATIKLTYALVKWKQDKLDEAIEMLQDVHSKYKCSTGYESLGYLLIIKGEYENALEFNLEAHDYNDSSNVIIDNLGESYYYLRDYDKAYEVYSKLIEKNPTFAEPYFYYGLILNEKGQNSEAVEMLEKALTFKESYLSDLTKDRIEQELLKIKKPQ